MLRDATVALGAVTARKVLWNVLSSPKTVACRSLLSGSRTRTPPPTDVHSVSFDLADLPVDAILREVAAADEQVHAIVRAVVHLAVEVLEVDLGVVVDEAALVGDHDRKPVGVERAALDRHAQLAPDVAGEHVGLRTVVVAVLRLELHRSPCRTRGDDVDHAAHAVVPVQARARSVDDLDAIDALERARASSTPSRRTDR